MKHWLLAIVLGSCTEALASFTYTNNTGSTVLVTYTFRQEKTSEVREYTRVQCKETYIRTVTVDSPTYSSTREDPVYYTDINISTSNELVTDDTGLVTCSEYVAPGETLAYNDSFSYGGSEIELAAYSINWSDEQISCDYNFWPFYEEIEHHYRWDYETSFRLSTTPFQDATTYDLVSVSAG